MRGYGRVFTATHMGFDYTFTVRRNYIILYYVEKDMCINTIRVRVRVRVRVREGYVH